MFECQCDHYEFNERLITEVEERPTLWDSRNPVRKSVRDAGWREVAAALGTTEEFVQRRWKNLRDTFLRKVRRQEASQDKRLVIRWSHFKRLMFLRDSVYDNLPPKIKREPAPRAGIRRRVRLPANPRWIPAAEPACESAAKEAGCNGELELIFEDHGEEESVDCEREEDEPASVRSVPVDGELVALSPSPSSETSSQLDGPAEQVPTSSSLVLSDVRSLVNTAPDNMPAVNRCVRRRHLSPVSGGGSGSTAVVPDSSGDVRSLGKVASQLDDWDHFLLSLKRHLRSTPDHLVGNAQMHLLQVAVGYGTGKVPTDLLPLTTL